MRVLITNNTLAHRAGSELYVRDLALRLLRTGHAPICYSRRLGEVAAEIRRASVPVVDDLDGLGEPPEVIHGQHHQEAMTAMLRFPAVPAIVVCHGWLPPEEAPPRFPTVRRYVAVDEPSRDRLVAECGIDPAGVVVLPNFVDLERFRPRRPLPARPRRALVFSNQASEESHLPAIRAACEAAGLELDVLGIAHGNATAAPEAVIGGYDVVFAKGRAALEAATVGAAVVLCDAVGLGPMAAAAELRRLRALNFGLRLLDRPVTAEGVAAELARYDAADATALAERLREEVGLGAAVDRLTTLYREVVAEQRELAPPSAEEVGRAASAYLRHGPLQGGDPWRDERERLVARAERLAGERDGAVAASVARGATHERQSAQRLAEAAEALSAERSAAAEAARELEHIRAALAAERAAAEELEGRRSRLEEELRTVAKSATWRARERLLRHRGLVALYRRLRRLPTEDGRLP